MLCYKALEKWGETLTSRVSPYISFVPQPGAFYVIYNRTEHVVKEHVVHVVKEAKEAKEAVLYFVKDFKVNFWQLNVLIYLY